MFNKLKLKLTLGNLLIVVLIFAIVFTGVYITMRRSITSQSDQLMNLLTYTIASGTEPQNSKLLGLLGNRAFIIADVSETGELTGYQGTPFTPSLTEENVVELVGKAAAQETDSKYMVLRLKLDSKSGAINIAIRASTIQSSTGVTYNVRLIKKSDNSISIVFVDIDYENDLLQSLRFNLIIVALAGLGLVFAGSLFMAERALKPVKTAWEKQKSFVADASHELRTPLSVIQTNLELVMDNKEDTVLSQYKWLENISWENKRMTKLVGDLLLLARADSDQKLLEMKNFSLSTSVEEAVTPFVPVAEEKGVEINFSIDPDVGFFGDESRIKQLAVILIDNAVKYTPPGGRISLGLKSNRENVEVIVADTGEGIAKEDLDKIFERFYRVDKARSSETGGTGLGLSIASWIVKEHHGTITVDSTLGQGTTFKITFPKNTKTTG